MNEVIIGLGEGDLETGFDSIDVEFKHHGKTQWKDRASLAATPELLNLLDRWQLLYPTVLNLADYGIDRSVMFDDIAVTNISSQDLKQLNHNFNRSLNDWLDGAGFNRIIKQLRSELNPQDRIVMTIVTDRQSIWQLPWHFWDFFTSYPHAVEVFCKPRFSHVANLKPQATGRVNVLGLFGQAPELELNPDFLKTLPQTHTQIVTTNSAYQVADSLTQTEPWDIFIFNGHGDTVEYSEIDSREGIIYLDKSTSIEIGQLKIAIECAVRRGLQIAIFNCCRGLGLADRLGDVNIPYIIVMREKIPDRIAQQFLVDLLQQYTQGQSFPAAFRHARERLVLSTGNFARFADWLPVLFHNPLSQHITWQDLTRSPWQNWIPLAIPRLCRYLDRPKARIWKAVCISLLISLLAISLKSFPQIANLDNTIVDRLQLERTQNIRPNTSTAILVNYQCMEVLGTCNDSGRFAREIEKIYQHSNPLAGILHLTFDDDLQEIARFHLVKSCPQRELQNADFYSLSELNCERVSSELEAIKQRANVQNFKLNRHAIAKITAIDLDKIESLSVETIRKMFDRQIVIFRSSNAVEPSLQNLATRDALAIEQITRASDPHHPLPLLAPWQRGVEFIWLLLWSSGTAIAAWRSQWRIITPLTIACHLLIAGCLLYFCSQMLPLVTSTICLIVVGGTIFSLRQIARTTRPLAERDF